MESILLTLDVACMVLLLRNVLRVIKTGNLADLGIFSFTEATPTAKHTTKAKKNTNGVQNSA